MEKRFFQTLLLLITFGLMSFGSLREVLGPEFSSAPNDAMIGDSEWRLLVNGSVSHPLNLTFNELVAMPNSTEYAELYCFGFFVTSGNWNGVRLGFVLEKAGLHPQAMNVTFYAADGYTTRLPVATAMRKDVIIAYEKDGEPLPETLRLVVPGENGAQWISMITEITIGTVPPIPEFPTMLTLAVSLTIITLAMILFQKKLGKPMHPTD